MQAILYIGHGTRSKKGAAEARAFVERVMSRLTDAAIQEMGFLELSEPSIEEGFQRCVDRGASVITVVPLFLLAAGHIKQDIPTILAAAQERFPAVEVKVKDPFGVQEKILDAVTELVRETVGTVNQQDRVLIVGRGSSDPDTQTDFAKIAEGIGERLGIDYVKVCYLAASEPRLQSGFQGIMENLDGAVIVVPYLLFSGLLIAEVDQEIRKWRKQGQLIYSTGTLSSHRAIEDIVFEKANPNFK